MAQALDVLPPDTRHRLTRIAGRIRDFADGQRRSLSAFETTIPGGAAGHSIAPVSRAGCYAPGGRYPLPSSLLMTAVTAAAPGFEEICVPSPRRDNVILACAALAGAKGFLVACGAQAIAALAFGAGEVPPCDMIVGPGNAYVTAAKRLVFGHVGIDTLAGPSELVVVGDSSSDPCRVAADLLAQAEHDTMAVPVLVSIGTTLADAVAGEIGRQLEVLSTRDVAKAALSNGGALVVATAREAIDACNALAPEHLHVHSEIPAGSFRNYGALFIGGASAEVLGDYGAGPNHVLPTGRASRYAGGLSVFTFLRVRTWLSVREAGAARDLYDDARWLGEVEGLEGHARSASARLNLGSESVI
jgi:phosphoribosyl-ATP pyrophosphohydrolase/phosphoribosyl-AMP cyclohydrolase/histidinol dehydrogenase